MARSIVITNCARYVAGILEQLVMDMVSTITRSLHQKLPRALAAAPSRSASAATKQARNVSTWLAKDAANVQAWSAFSIASKGLLPKVSQSRRSMTLTIARALRQNDRAPRFAAIALHPVEVETG